MSIVMHVIYGGILYMLIVMAISNVILGNYSQASLELSAFIGWGLGWLRGYELAKLKEALRR